MGGRSWSALANILRMGNHPGRHTHLLRAAERKIHIFLQFRVQIQVIRVGMWDHPRRQELIREKICLTQKLGTEIESEPG